MASPVDERAEDAAIAEVRDDRPHPGDIEGEEFVVGHLARRHGEFAVAATSHMPANRDVVRLVGEDEAGRGVALRRAGANRRLRGAAADQPVRRQAEIHRRCGRQPSRSALGANGPCSTTAVSTSPRMMWSISSRVKPETSIGASAGSIVEFDLQLVEVPLAVLGEPVDGEASGARAALYPIYIRGEVYLLLHKGKEAAAEFQNFLDHRGIAFNSPLGTLARLQLGRAYALQDNRGQSRAAYQDFFGLWSDADQDTPILITAKSEYTKLK